MASVCESYEVWGLVWTSDKVFKGEAAVCAGLPHAITPADMDSVWKLSRINQDLTGNSTESRLVEINCGCQSIPSWKFPVVSHTLFYAALRPPFLGHNWLAT
jgi:hypothetical protein